MAKFRKKPVVIEAKQWFKDGDHEEVAMLSTWLFKDHECEHCGKPWVDHGMVPTLEGEHIVCPEDWIITGVKGEHYPCKPDIFEMTYETAKSELEVGREALLDELNRIERRDNPSEVPYLQLDVQEKEFQIAALESEVSDLQDRIKELKDEIQKALKEGKEDG